MAAVVCLFALVSCAAGEGEIQVRIYGEAFIEEGIPVDAFADGWTIGYERFTVELRDVSVAGVDVAETSAFDLTQPSEGAGQLVGRVAAEAGEHQDLQFTIAQIEIVGWAENGGVTKTFSWTFDTPTSYGECETVIAVPRDGGGEVEVTVHADHLFYDSLVSENPNMRFDPIAAADTDSDGEVTQAELEVATIGAYDPGNLNVDQLWPYMAALVHTMGHVDGEGHCRSST